MIVDCCLGATFYNSIDLADGTIYTTARTTSSFTSLDQKIISDNRWSLQIVWALIKITRLVTDHRRLGGSCVKKCLAVVVRAGVLGVELALGDVFGEAGHVLPVVVHPLHATRQGPAGGEVEGLQGWAAVQQLRQRLQTHSSPIQV